MRRPFRFPLKNTRRQNDDSKPYSNHPYFRAPSADVGVGEADEMTRNSLSGISKLKILFSPMDIFVFFRHKYIDKGFSISDSGDIVCH